METTNGKEHSNDAGNAFPLTPLNSEHKNVPPTTSGNSAGGGDGTNQQPSGENARRAMSPVVPPHHHIRVDDTVEVENVQKQESIKSNRRYYSTSSERAAPSAYERFTDYLRVKFRYLGYGLYFIVFLLFAALFVFAAIIVYWMAVHLLTSQPILIDSETCQPMKVTLCQKFDVRYSYTTLPSNEQSLVNEKLTSTYLTILGIKCYTLLPVFLCSQYAPSCNSTGQAVPMCKSICKEAKYRCNFFLDIFDISWPDDIDCDTLPDSQDPDICVGNMQAHEMNQFANRQICKENGFRCDTTRCIPANWKCDGYIDCKDLTDEKGCSNCTDVSTFHDEKYCTVCTNDQFHCGHGRCIDRNNICDGRNDCPDARDETQCYNLSESMGHYGKGELQIWNGKTNSWKFVCGEEWTVPEKSEEVCRRLGYRRSNETRMHTEMRVTKLTEEGRLNPPYVPFSRRSNIRNPCWFTYTGVHLKCEHFECGRTSHSLQGKVKRRNVRIVGGDESYPGKWPWLVSFHGGPAEVFFCAGVLISEWWVLTAAHCIGKMNDTTGWVLNLGVTRRTATPLFVRQRKVAKLIKHPRFQMSLDYYYSDDIALVLLDEKVDFDEFLRPVCLPANSSVPLEEGTKCTVIGWGKKIHDDYADYQSAIHEVEVPIVSHSKCTKWYSKQLPYNPIPDSMICAGFDSGGKDSCQGDSGGPLLCYNEQQSWFVAGVVSWGISCAQPQLPGIYSNVPKYLDWIHSETLKYRRPISVNVNLDYPL